jgi:hypothetical protein
MQRMVGLPGELVRLHTPERGNARPEGIEPRRHAAFREAGEGRSDAIGPADLTHR